MQWLTPLPGGAPGRRRPSRDAARVRPSGAGAERIGGAEHDARAEEGRRDSAVFKHLPTRKGAAAQDGGHGIHPKRESDSNYPRRTPHGTVPAAPGLGEGGGLPPPSPPFFTPAATAPRDSAGAGFFGRLLPTRRLQAESNSARRCENHECYVIFPGIPGQELLPRIHHFAFDCLGPLCRSFANGRVEPGNAEGPVQSTSCLNQSVGVKHQDVSGVQPDTGLGIGIGQTNP